MPHFFDQMIQHGQRRDTIAPTSVQDVSPSNFRELIAHSENEVAGARARLMKAQTEVEHHSGEIVQLQQHVAALESEFLRLRSQAQARGDELSDLRARLGEAVLETQNALFALAEQRKATSSLRRRVAELVPKAQSNQAALAALRGLTNDERDRLRSELGTLAQELRSVTASKFWRLSGPLRWMVTRARGAS